MTLPVPRQARHRRVYGTVAVDVLPPLLQAIAALAAAVALTFAGRRFVSDLLVTIVIVAAIALTVGVSVWGWAARKAVVDRAQAVNVGVPRRSEWTGWPWLAGVLTITMCIPVGIIYRQGLRPAPSYASNYDGLDPVASTCVQSAVNIPSDTHPTLHTATGQAIGHVELRRSETCGTIWARVVFDPGAGPTLKGGTAIITLVRAGDDARAPYSLPLRGGDAGFGNMLSDAGACVSAVVYLLQPNSNTRGPSTKTVCG